MNAVEVYWVGLVCMSVCAATDTPREEIEKQANAQHPAGISSSWAISDDETFAGGEPHPGPCNSAEGRQHWLLTC